MKNIRVQSIFPCFLGFPTGTKSMNDSTEENIDEVYRILKYLQRTTSCGLF